MQVRYCRWLVVSFALFALGCSSDVEKEGGNNGINNGANNGNSDGGVGDDADLGPPPETCDGQSLDEGEACDGDDLAGETCQTLGFAGGTLACRGDCLGFDTSGCTTDGGMNACPANQHLCDGACVLDEDGPGCGPQCELCPSDPNGETFCASAQCGLLCADGYRRCGAECAECPSGSEAQACDQTSCVAATCAAGEYDLDGTCTEWQMDSSVGSSDNHPNSMSMVIDSSGVVHVAFYNSWSGGLHYARYDGSWTDTPIGIQEGGPGSPSIALDGNETPHIIHSAIDANGIEIGLTHYTKTQSGWDDELIMAGGRMAGELVIEDGIFHVAFLRKSGAEDDGSPGIPDHKNSEVIYGKKDGAAWEFTYLDQEDELGWGFGRPTLAVSADTIYVVYGDGRNLHMVEGAPGRLNRSVVTTGRIVAPTLELDEDGKPTLTYRRDWDEEDFSSGGSRPQSVIYAVRDAGLWTETQLDGAVEDSVGFDFPLAYDTDGNAHVLYYIGSTTLGDPGSLRMARETAAGWEFDVIDSTGQPGLSSALTFDSNGRPHVVASDDDIDRMKYFWLP